MGPSHDRAREELRAELSSVFIASHLDIPADVPNHASYVKSWAKALKDDKREIFRAASDAQKIADYLLAFHPAYALSLKAQAQQPAPEQNNARQAFGARPGAVARPAVA